MVEKKKLDRWADKLLDTGKRNNLISFRDTKGGTAEVLSPDPESIFLKCSVGRVFEVFDPKLPEDYVVHCQGWSFDQLAQSNGYSISDYVQYSKGEEPEYYIYLYPNARTTDFNRSVICSPVNKQTPMKLVVEYANYDM